VSQGRVPLLSGGGEPTYGRRFFGPGAGPVYGPPQDEAQLLKERQAYLPEELETVQERRGELAGPDTQLLALPRF
jgi:hypothetical protein